MTYHVYVTAPTNPLPLALTDTFVCAWGADGTLDATRTSMTFGIDPGPREVRPAVLRVPGVVVEDGDRARHRRRERERERVVGG